MNVEWWRKFSFAIELRFAGVEGADTLKQWAFNYELKVDRYRQGRKVLWPRAWIRILGVSIGAGFYIDLGIYNDSM